MLWNYMIPILIFLIPIIAILSGVAKRWIKMEERQIELADNIAGEQATQYAAKVKRLEAHEAVLNRIVTDRNEDQTAQIESLREPSKQMN